MCLYVFWFLNFVHDIFILSLFLKLHNLILYIQNSLQFTPIQYNPIKYNGQSLSFSLNGCVGAAAFRVRATGVRWFYNNGLLDDDTSKKKLKKYLITEC